MEANSGVLSADVIRQSNYAPSIAAGAGGAASPFTTAAGVGSLLAITDQCSVSVGQPIAFKPHFALLSTLESRFQQLLTEWRRSTRYTSSATEITGHWAYQEIIELGPAAIPLIFKELRQRPEHWFHALRLLTGYQPPKSSRQNMGKMREAWLRWADRKRY